MGGLIVVNRPSFIIVPDELVEHFISYMWDVYEFECAYRNIPTVYDLLSGDNLFEICDEITSYDIWGDTSYHETMEMTYDEDDKEEFYDACNQNFHLVQRDAERLLDYQSLCMDDHGTIVNKPIKEVW